MGFAGEKGGPPLFLGQGKRKADPTSWEQDCGYGEGQVEGIEVAVAAG
jgi:hypothetical protein